MSIFIDKSYVNRLSPHLELFSWKKDDLANCRCPICGDSQRNKKKARGYFYKKANHMYYKCHNCDYGTTLANMLKNISPALHKEYRLENYRGGQTGKPNTPEPDFSFKKPVFRESIGKQISDLPPDHEAIRVLKQRKVPESLWHRFSYAENFYDTVREINDKTIVGRENRLVIPIYDSEKKVIGLQGRSLNGEIPKYITIKANDYDDVLIYGKDQRINWAENVHVFEGPIDSLFIPNSLAVLGSNLKLLDEKLSSSKLVFCFDNEPRNKQIVSKMNEATDLGKRLCIWPDSLKEKDVNDMIISGLTSDEILDMITANTYEGPSAKLRLSTWRKV